MSKERQGIANLGMFHTLAAEKRKKLTRAEGFVSLDEVDSV
jgi:hypothetical protein